MSQLLKKTFYTRASYEDNQNFLFELDKSLQSLVEEPERKRLVDAVASIPQPLFLYSPVYFALALVFIRTLGDQIMDYSKEKRKQVFDDFMKKYVYKFYNKPKDNLAEAKTVRRKINLIRYVRFINDLIKQYNMDI
jgi:hypothetical protein